MRSSAYTATVWLVAALLSVGAVASMQTTTQSSGVAHTPVTAQELPHDSGHSLTAIVVEFAIGVIVTSHRHAGIVFASVLRDTVRSRLNDGDVMAYRAGQGWVEPPGTVHTHTENPSQSMPARLLAVCIAPTGVRLTTADQERSQERDPGHC